MDEFESIRKEFPHTEKMIYLEHAAVSPLSRRVVDSVRSYLADRHVGRVKFDDDMVAILIELRKKIATLLHTATENIALTPNTSTGLNILAQGLPLEAGDHILVPDVEFPSNVYPYLNLQKKGVIVDFLSPRDGRIGLGEIQEAVTPETRLLAISFVQFTNGFRANLEAISKWCHAQDIWLAVDGIQGVGALQMDVEKWGIDFLSVGGHKWMMAPIGTGFLYVTPEMLKIIAPPFASWLSVKNPWKLLDFQLDFLNSAQRFEMASQNFMGFLGMHASLELLLEVGSKAIEQRILTLTDYLVAGLEKLGAKILSPRGPGERSGIVSFSLLFDNVELHRELEKRNIFVSYRLKNLRASPHFYNNFADVDALLSALGDLI